MSGPSGEKTVKLLDFWACPFGQRCRIVLAEKGVEYEYLEQDLQNKTHLLLQSNPVYKKVPVLLHQGHPISESLIIIQYIDEAWPGRTRNILPPDAYDRAHARFWVDYIDKKVYECGNRLWKLEGEAQKEAKKEFIEILKTLEAELGDKKYFGADGVFGLVDIALVPFTAWFDTYDVYSGLCVEKESPKIAEWAKRCIAERESIRKTLHDPMKIFLYVRFLKANKHDF